MLPTMLPMKTIREMRRASLVVFAAALLSPTTGEAQATLEQIVRIEPSREYRGWWEEVVSACDCTPSTTVERVAWFVFPGAEQFQCVGLERRCEAQWFLLKGGQHVIVVAELMAREKRWVVHEMIHAVLAEPEHIREFQRIKQQIALW